MKSINWLWSKQFSGFAEDYFFPFLGAYSPVNMQATTAGGIPRFSYLVVKKNCIGGKADRAYF